MPGINSFKRGRRKCGWQLAILVFSLSAVFSACEGGGTSPNPPPVSANEWTWISGSSTDQMGVYGTQGIAAPSNVPGARNMGCVLARFQRQTLALRGIWL